MIPEKWIPVFGSGSCSREDSSSSTDRVRVKGRGRGLALEVVMTLFSRRRVLALSAAALAAPAVVRAADKPKEIRIDWATYNPVSMVLKDKGFLEKEFAKDGIGVRWVQTLGSNKALEFLNAGSIDFGSTAGSAALLSKINSNPIKSF